MNLFDRIKEERERLNYSQTAFAALADASKHAQINWEKGIASPNAAALAAWADVGLDVLYVVTGQHAAVKPLPADEQMWLLCYRGWDMPVKKQELARALGLSPTEVRQGVEAMPPPAVQISGNQQHNTGSGVVQIGSMGKSPVKRRR